MCENLVNKQTIPSLKLRYAAQRKFKKFHIENKYSTYFLRFKDYLHYFYSENLNHLKTTA